MLFICICVINDTNTNPTPAGPTGVPIFLVDGASRVADNYDDLWDGSIAEPIWRSQFGNYPVGGSHFLFVWTGTNTSGTEYAGSFAVGTSSVIIATSTSTDASWIAVAAIVNSGTADAHLYALSGILTAAPEPTTASLLGVALAFASTRRQRSK